MIRVEIASSTTNAEYRAKEWAISILLDSIDYEINTVKQERSYYSFWIKEVEVLRVSDRWIGDFFSRRSKGYQLEPASATINSIAGAELYVVSGDTYSQDLFLDNILTLPDIVGLIFLLLASANEFLSPETDTYGRSPEEIAIGYSLANTNICWVDDWAKAIKKLLNLEDGIRREKKLVSCVTHDIDIIESYPRVGSFQFTKQLIADLYRSNWRRHPLERLMSRSLGHYFPKIEWNISTLYKLVDAYKEYRLNATFYLLLDPLGQMDIGHYSYSSRWIKDFILYAHLNGCKIGLHTSYYQSMNHRDYLNAIKKFRSYMSRILNCDFDHVVTRNHYLRFSYKESVGWMSSAGVKSDSSVGYSKCFGWRLGTRWPFEMFDLLKGEATSVVQEPFGLMDNALIADQSKDLILNEDFLKALELIGSCTEQSAILVHPHNFHTDLSIAIFCKKISELLSSR